MKRRNRQTAAANPIAPAAFCVASPDLLNARANRPRELALLIRQLEVAAILNEIY